MPSLLRSLKKFYATDARKHLPWRKTKDPYKILVSELMLQQTQVDRVIPFYTRFIKRFPTAVALSQAPLGEVLKLWQGLGYNRRAKFLHEAAKQLALLKKFPKEVLEIEKLKGVGHYTARAVAAFAFNSPEVFVETNIRTVIFHSHILENKRITTASDAELLTIVEVLLKESKMEPCDFYAALMDYGSYLKRQGVRLNSRSKHYTRQSKFEGSARQLRGAILRELLAAPATLAGLSKKLAKPVGEVEREVERLQKESLVVMRKNKVSIA